MTKSLFIEQGLTIISLFSQLLTAIFIIFLIYYRKQNLKLMLVLAFLLIVIIFPLTLHNLILFRSNVEFSFEIINALVSLLLLATVIALSLNKENFRSSFSKETALQPDMKVLARISIILGILAFFSSFIFGYLGYSITREKIVQENTGKNAILAKTVNEFISKNRQGTGNAAFVAELQDLWSQVKPLLLESHLLLTDSNGDIIFDSTFSSLSGKSAGDYQVTELEGEKRTVKISEILKSKKALSEAVTIEQPDKSTAFMLFNPAAGILTIVYSPDNFISGEVNPVIMPWFIGNFFITIILLPLSLGLLLWAFFNTQKNQYEFQKALQESLEEKEVLLKEIHHRVKNNLQVIYSLIGLQKKYIDNEKYANMLTESQQRIKSMAMIHEKLYQSADLGNINFSDYIQSLSNSLFETYKTSPGVKITTEIENISLDIDRAIPCGLIINELISNSLKHAFRETNTGIINIAFKQENEFFMLVIKDNGSGIKEDVDIKKSASLGLKLVTTLTRQLRGKVDINREQGTEFCISFPV